MAIQLRVLGTLDLRGPDGAELRSVLVQPKRIALLSYLALARPHGFHRRDSLVGLFWPEQDGERARASLRQALYALRHSLGDHVLETRGDEIGLDAAAFDCDVWAFERAVAESAFDRAVALYGGPLLRGLYVSGAPELEWWVEAERRRLDEAYGEVLERLAEITSPADPVHGLHYWHMRAEQSPYCGRITVRLMEALAARGDAPAAIREAQRHALLLREELDAEPDPEVSALADRLRREPPRSPVRERAAAEAAARPPVQAPPAVEGAVGVAAPSARPAGQRRARLPGAVAVLLVPLLVAAAVMLWGSANRLLPGPSSVAVLPFENRSGDPAQDYLAAGLTDAVIGSLGMIEQLRVTSGRAAARGAGSGEALPELAARLGVQRIVRGSVTVSGRRLQVGVQLFDGATGQVMASREYGGRLADLLVLDNEIARDVAGALDVRLDAAVQARLARLPTENVHAFQLYLHGRQAMNAWNAPDMDRAIAAFEAAIAADSGFALARAALANAYLEKAEIFDPGGELREKAYVEIETALLLDPDLPEPYMARGNLLWTDANGFPHEAALREFLRAAALQPSSSAAHDRLAHIYLHVGLLDQALDEAERAQALDPGDYWSRFRIALVLNLQGRYPESVEALRRLPPHVVPVLTGPLLAEAYLHLGHPDSAVLLLDRLVREHPNDPWVHAQRAVTLAVLRDSAGARAEVAATTRLVPGFLHGHHAELALGTAYAQLGQPDSAVYWLRHAAERGFPCYPRFAHDALLADLRRHAPFRVLVGELHAEWQRYGQRFGDT
jgi:DNA-binding SARP family transcriptional activator/TolB-like protein